MTAARLGKRDIDVSRDLGGLRETSATLDPESLRLRLAEDGYLLLRGFHRAEDVRAARDEVLSAVVGGRVPQESIEALEVFRGLVAGQPIMDLFSGLLGGPVLTFDYKWLRAVAPGGSSPAHCDRVFMGRGTSRVLTCWTPIGDVPFDRGPLALWLGSPNLDRVLATYGRHDVDRDLIAGYLADDPWDLVECLGGRWHTAAFAAGDLLIFGLDVVHCSLVNTSNEPRTSCDTRYQSVEEPVDGRWVGRWPIGHYRWGRGAKETVAEGRRRWGLAVPF